MSDYKIEDDVPMPLDRKSSAKYPFPDMQIGQSFYTEGGNVRGAASSFSLRNDVKFASRKEGAGIRVWRIE